MWSILCYVRDVFLYIQPFLFDFYIRTAIVGFAVTLENWKTVSKYSLKKKKQFLVIGFSVVAQHSHGNEKGEKKYMYSHGTF